MFLRRSKCRLLKVLLLMLVGFQILHVPLRCVLRNALRPLKKLLLACSGILVQYPHKYLLC